MSLSQALKLKLNFLADLYLKRFRKERKLRKQLEDQLEIETKKIQALESALRSLSYETLVQVKETIAREAAHREKQKLDASDMSNGCMSPESEPAAVSTPSTDVKMNYSSGRDNLGVLPSYSSATGVSPAQAQLNYNISQMTSSPTSPSHSPRLGTGSISSTNIFNSSIASSLPSSVSTSF